MSARDLAAEGAVPGQQAIDTATCPRCHPTYCAPNRCYCHHNECPANPKNNRKEARNG